MNHREHNTQHRTSSRNQRSRYVVTTGAVAAATLLCCTLLPSFGYATGIYSYGIEAPMDYSTNDCNMLANIDLPDTTSSLQTALNAEGWSGYRYMDTGVTSDAWPQDLWESCGPDIQGTSGLGNVQGGLDSSYGDSKNLVVFSGHGGPNWMIWSHTHNGECTMNLGYHTRLGEMAGASASAAIWAACSVLQAVPLNDVESFKWQGLRQQFGFSNEDYTVNDRLRDFFNATSTQSNTNAWINVNSNTSLGKAAILTMSRTSIADCWNQSNGNKLKAQVNVLPYNGGPSCGAEPPTQYYCSTFYN